MVTRLPWLPQNIAKTKPTLEVEERWASALFNMDGSSKGAPLAAGKTEKSGRKALDLARWSPLMLIHWQSLQLFFSEAIERHTLHVSKQTSKQARGIFRCIYNLYRFVYPPRQKYIILVRMCWVVMRCWPVYVYVYVYVCSSWCHMGQGVECKRRRLVTSIVLCKTYCGSGTRQKNVGLHQS